MSAKRVKIYHGLGSEGVDGSTPFSLVAAGTTNPTLVKSTPGLITGIHAINVNAAVRYLKLYDTRDKPTAGAGTPVRRYGIPGNTAGAGFVFPIFVPLSFLVGIGFTLTTGSADTDSGALTAGDVILTIEYI